MPHGAETTAAAALAPPSRRGDEARQRLAVKGRPPCGSTILAPILASRARASARAAASAAPKEPTGDGEARFATSAVAVDELFAGDDLPAQFHTGDFYPPGRTRRLVRWGEHPDACAAAGGGAQPWPYRGAAGQPCFFRPPGFHHHSHHQHHPYHHQHPFAAGFPPFPHPHYPHAYGPPMPWPRPLHSGAAMTHDRHYDPEDAFETPSDDELSSDCDAEGTRTCDGGAQDVDVEDDQAVAAAFVHANARWCEAAGFGPADVRIVRARSEAATQQPTRVQRTTGVVILLPAVVLSETLRQTLVDSFEATVRGASPSITIEALDSHPMARNLSSPVLLSEHALLPPNADDAAILPASRLSPPNRIRALLPDAFARKLCDLADAMPPAAASSAPASLVQLRAVKPGEADAALRLLAAELPQATSFGACVRRILQKQQQPEGSYAPPGERSVQYVAALFGAGSAADLLLRNPFAVLLELVRRGGPVLCVASVGEGVLRVEFGDVASAERARGIEQLCGVDVGCLEGEARCSSPPSFVGFPTHHAHTVAAYLIRHGVESWECANAAASIGANLNSLHQPTRARS
ncbi:hypothetical protein DIPPA_24498 [Diplonema papillatum]|nr:hypothetical protein DIPPA_24498 [Diplonema papillatum]